MDGFRTCNIDVEYRFRGRQKKFGPIYGRRSLIYEVLKMKNTLLFTFVVILVFVTSSLALNCKCNKKACPKLECPEGKNHVSNSRKSFSIISKGSLTNYSKSDKSFPK